MNTAYLPWWDYCLQLDSIKCRKKKLHGWYIWVPQQLEHVYPKKHNNMLISLPPKNNNFTFVIETDPSSVCRYFHQYYVGVNHPNWWVQSSTGGMDPLPTGRPQTIETFAVIKAVLYCLTQLHWHMCHEMWEALEKYRVFCFLHKRWPSIYSRTSELMTGIPTRWSGIYQVVITRWFLSIKSFVTLLRSTGTNLHLPQPP